MSRYDWESGTVYIPAKAWAPLKKALREAWNEQRQRTLRLAETLQSHLKTEFKGRRNINRHEIESFLYRKAEGESREVEEAAVRLVFKTLKEGSASQTKKITQGMLSDTIGPKATTATMLYRSSHDEWSIALDNESRSVHWCVHENNHAVEEARESLMGDSLFRHLRSIEYGRSKKMGGVIVGNDEYNQDNREYGGGANYVTMSFGKLGNAC